MSGAGTVPYARDLHRQMRAWRRGRAQLGWWELVQEAYVAVLSTLLVGAMTTSVVLGLREMSAVACTGACTAARGVAPWVAVGAAVLAALAAARLLGPVFLAPAAGPWLLSTPLDRADLLRPALLRALAASQVAVPVVATAALVSGVPLPEVVGAGAVASSAALSAVALVADGQLRGRAGARPVTWAVALLTWALVAWAGLAPLSLPTGPVPAWALVALWVVASLLALRLVRQSVRALPATPRSALTATQDAWPSLSGALAAMDVTLLFDVLVSRRWAAVTSVEPRRGGPRGWWAMVHRDLVRVGRTPQPWVALAGLALVPYAVAAAGVGEPLAVLVALLGFLAGPSLATGLRVVSRTPTLARALGWPTWQVRAAHLLVPGLALVLFGAASAGALASTLGWPTALPLAAGATASALASTVRWIVSQPPNYAQPLLSTPAGGLPPGMLGGLAKGFDVWLVTSLPLLLGPNGITASLVLSLGVVWWRLAAD